MTPSYDAQINSLIHFIQTPHEDLAPDALKNEVDQRISSLLTRMQGDKSLPQDLREKAEPFRSNFVAISPEEFLKNKAETIEKLRGISASIGVSLANSSPAVSQSSSVTSLEGIIPTAVLGIISEYSDIGLLRSILSTDETQLLTADFTSLDAEFREISPPAPNSQIADIRFLRTRQGTAPLSIPSRATPDDQLKEIHKAIQTDPTQAAIKFLGYMFRKIEAEYIQSAPSDLPKWLAEIEHLVKFSLDAGIPLSSTLLNLLAGLPVSEEFFERIINQYPHFQEKPLILRDLISSCLIGYSTFGFTHPSVTARALAPPQKLIRMNLLLNQAEKIYQEKRIIGTIKGDQLAPYFLNEVFANPDLDFVACFHRFCKLYETLLSMSMVADALRKLGLKGIIVYPNFTSVSSLMYNVDQSNLANKEQIKKLIQDLNPLQDSYLDLSKEVRINLGISEY